MRHYEIVAVIHPDQQGRIAAMIELYKKIVTDDGGILHRFEDWGRRPLAYPIQNQHKAQYLLMNIECENATLEKLRETFRFSDSILRSLITKCEHAITEDSPIKKAENKQSDNKSHRSDTTFLNEDAVEEGMEAVQENDNLSADDDDQSSDEGNDDDEESSSDSSDSSDDDGKSAKSNTESDDKETSK